MSYDNPKRLHGEKIERPKGLPLIPEKETKEVIKTIAGLMSEAVGSDSKRATRAPMCEIAPLLDDDQRTKQWWSSLFYFMDRKQITDFVGGSWMVGDSEGFHLRHTLEIPTDCQDVVICGDNFLEVSRSFDAQMRFGFSPKGPDAETSMLYRDHSAWSMLDLPPRSMTFFWDYTFNNIQFKLTKEVPKGYPDL